MAVINYQVPTVRILGAASRTVSRFSSVTANSDAYMLGCAGSANADVKSYDNLEYEWSISEGGVQTPVLPSNGLASTSSDRTKFVLSSYTLQTGRLYNVLLNVLSLESQKAATASVQLSAQESGEPATASQSRLCAGPTAPVAGTLCRRRVG